MAEKHETPFDNIESSHEYVGLLVEAIEESEAAVREDLEQAVREGAQRRQEALQLVAHKLAKLKGQMTTSRRLLNDLRTLRRLLLHERPPGSATAPAPRGQGDEV